MHGNEAIVGICSGHSGVEAAIKELTKLGFEMNNISAFGKAYVSDEEAVGFCVTDEQLFACGGSAGFWERLWELLGYGGFFFVPGVGPIAVAGRFACTLARKINAGIPEGGLSALGAAMKSLGVPPDSTFRYEIAIDTTEYVLIAVGSPELIAEAKTVLEDVGVSEITAGDEGQTQDTNRALQMA